MPDEVSGFRGYDKIQVMSSTPVTLVTEFPIVWLGVRRPGGRAAAWLAVVFLGTHLFSHGTLWWVWRSIPGAYTVRLLIGESAVTLVEAAAYRGLLPEVGLARALLVSLLANGVSTAVGLALWLLLVP
jgi:isoprenylcysteine carboxyl methyltransferase (ICMT) family protein YpbQ